MSQSHKFEQIVKIVNEFSSMGEARGVGKLYTQDLSLNGRTITVNNKTLINMGSCSYLGLELDNRLKEAAIDAVKKFGTYFSCSRIYVSCGNYLELEELLGKLFNAHILLTTNSTLGHHCVMPIIIGTNDMVIYDQQAHISMQELSYKLNHFGTGLSVLRHNRLDELEEKIDLYKSKYDKIWYVIDGVYSMFGDLAPIKEIIKLLDKHKKLHLYVDDAHGMSWAGQNGSGYTMSQTTLHPKMVMGTSMAKGFGSCGGIFIFKDKELRDKVKKWGGPLSYSGPQEPATVAAAIASAKIHLSGEIDELQNNLQKKIKFCNEIMASYKIPLVSESCSPIFFVACGLLRVGFNLVERLISDGFYTNIGAFPAVPETCTGVRFTMTNHITYEDIERLAKAFSYHHPLALRDEDRSMKDIYKAFRKFTDFENRLGAVENFTTVQNKDNSAPIEKGIVLKTFHSVAEIDKDIWNNLLGDRGAFDYDNMLLLEQVFSNNIEVENNWKFYYYLITDTNNLPILCTFFTLALSKDDMLSSEGISEKIETLRQENPYYLTSMGLMMGTMLTNGDHLYLNKNNPDWKNAVSKLLDAVWQVQHDENANSLFLRDFDANDTELSTFLIHQGFVKIDNLENNVLTVPDDCNLNLFFDDQLSSKKRYQIKTEVLPNMDDYSIKINSVDDQGLKTIFDLYKNVKKTNLSLNTFDLPYKLFEKVRNSANWEILTLHYKNSDNIIAMALCSKTKKNYSHVIYGFDDTFTTSDSIYKKMLYFVIKRAFELKAEKVYMGITANDTKRKFGAEQYKQVAYIQIKDHYNQDVIDSMSFQE